MSLNLSTIEIDQFLSDAHIEFQSEGFKLERAVRVKTGTKGANVHFPVFGSGIANQKAPQDDVVPLNVSNRDVSVALEDWYAPEYVDRSFKNKLAVNAVEEYTKICSMALARRADQLIIDPIVAANYGGGAGQGNQVAAGGTGFTFAKFREAHQRLRENSATGDTYLVIDANAESDLLNETSLTSSDFVNTKAIAGDGLDGMRLMGINIIVMPNMGETGLPGSLGYMFNKNAVGMAMSERLGGDISWENEKASYLINMWLEANAVVIDATGMVEIAYV